MTDFFLRDRLKKTIGQTRRSVDAERLVGFFTNRLFLLAVQRVLAKYRVVLHQLQAVGGIPTVLGGVITRRTWCLGALEGDLNAISLCHDDR